MTEGRWFDNNEHPAEDTLLLHLDGALEPRDAEAVARHLRECWECRARVGVLERGIRNFMEYRREVLLPAMPAPAGPGRLRARLREEPEARSRVPRLAWAAGIVLVAAVGVQLFLATSQPALRAGEVLDNARRSTQLRARPGRIISRKVQIRRGTFVMQQTLFLGRPVQNPLAPPPDPEMRQALEVARVAWQDPLNPDHFAQWRQEQRDSRDEVIAGAGQVTVRTTVAGAPVRAASLTVNRAGWRPVARRVEFRDQPALEVTELAWEERELSLLAKAPLSARPQPVRIPPAPAPAAPPAESEVEEAEVRLRESLETLRVDALDVTHIWRRGEEVCFFLWTDSEERRSAVMREIAAIPRVVECGLPASPPEAPVAAAGDGATHFTAPPLAKALVRRLGGLDASNQYLDGVRDEYLRLLTEIAALERLGARYTPERMARLPAALRERVDAMQARQRGRVHDQGEAYLNAVSPILDAMLSLRGVTVEPAVEPAAGETSAWGEEPRRLQRAFQRLFVREQVREPLSLSAEDLLREAAEARAKITRHISTLNFR